MHLHTQGPPGDLYLPVFRIDVIGIPQHRDAGQLRGKLAQELQSLGVEVLYDDREETPGVKFNDADLLGMPLRTTVSPRNLSSGSAEVKARTEAQSRLIPLAEAAAPVSITRLRRSRRLNRFARPREAS